MNPRIQLRDRFCRLLSGFLPRRLVLHCLIRGVEHARFGLWGQEKQVLTASMVLNRWGVQPAKHKGYLSPRPPLLTGMKRVG